MRKRSIRYYFFTSITTVLVASVLIMGLVQTILFTNYFQDQQQTQLNQVTSVVANGVRSEEIDLRKNSASAQYAIGYIATIFDGDIIITDPYGVVTFSAGRCAVQVGAVLPKKVTEQLYNSGGSYNEMGDMGGFFAANHYNAGVPLLGSQGELLGYVFASSLASDLQAYLADTLSTFILSAILVMLVSSVLSLLLFNRFVVPLRAISDVARQFGEGDYSARVPVEGDDELARLAVAFNEMASTFQASDTSHRNFMGNIAHELRTPMTSIKGFVDGMLDGTIPPELHDKYLGIVSDEVGRLARLTKNMLDISRLEAGEFTSNPTVFDLRRPALGVIQGAEQRLRDKNIRVEGFEGEAVMVRADEDFVYQVLYNIIDNALKFVDEGGTISIGFSTAKNMVTTGIRNTGAGMPADVAAHVFDRFYKGDKSRGVNARGAGLGLNISRVLVMQMGGKIWAASEEGVWTEFMFSLPAGQQRRGARQGAERTETIQQ